MEAIEELYVYSNPCRPASKCLDQLGKYQDFTPRFHKLNCMNGCDNFMSLYFLERVLDDAQAEIEFDRVCFEGACQGHAFSIFGHDTMVMFNACEFLSDAADAFRQGMITKSDRNVGLTGMAIDGWVPFPENILITLFRRNLLQTYKLRCVCKDYHSAKGLSAMQKSQLRSLSLHGIGFSTYDYFARFLHSFHSSTLERLALCSYYSGCASPVVALAIEQCPMLIHFSLDHARLNRAHWDCILNAIRNHKVLSSLTLKYGAWKDITYEEAAAGFTVMLKENANIEKLETESFFSNGRDSPLLETKIMLHVVHNYYSKRFSSLHRTEAANTRAALVGKALGIGLQRKPSFQYELLKSNVDLIRKHC